MLETLVSSRIRRTLFEHVLTHPHERFYLRGLAKTLDLPISPLRRELLRLERSAMLSAEQEGNMRFYTVNTASAAFRQLQHVGQPLEGSLPLELLRAQGSGLRGVAPSPARPGNHDRRAGEPPAQSLKPIPVGVISARSASPVWRSPLQGPAFIGVVSVGTALMLLMAAVFYLTITNQRAMSQVSKTLMTRRADVTVVTPPHQASGTMRGARWQIVPGGFGGFSSGASNDSH